MIVRKCFAFALVLSLSVMGCDEDASGDGNGDGNGGGGNALATGEGPCDEASECAGDVCIAIVDGDNPPVYCTEQCGSDTCPSGFYCDETTLALIPLPFCRFGGSEPAQPEVPEEPPTLPCQDDTDCDGDLVCAEIDGERGCAVPCAVEDDCTPPAVQGIVLDLATCGSDDNDRSVCVGDPACYPNPGACISGGGFPGF